MSAPGSYRPSLPPRTPQPPGYTDASLGYPDTGYPLLSPESPSRNPAYVPNSRPPPIPPRPPGYEITTLTCSNEQFPLDFSTPPPPPGPPPGIVRPVSANPPSYPYHYPEAPSLNQGCNCSRALSSNLHGQNGSASIPLPPPNSHDKPALQRPASTHFIPPSHPPDIRQHLPSPAPQVPAKETIKIPPLVHTTAIGTPDVRPSENNTSSSATSQPADALILSLSPNQLLSPSSEYSQAQFQSENEIKGKPVAPSAEGLPALAPPAVTSCIDDPVTFATDWYWHPDAPGFLICSRCYVDYIYGTKFWNLFRKERFSGGEPRICRFSKPRMRNHLLKDALATGSLEPALAWMRSRSQIPDCKGIEGVKGNVGIKWYMARLNDIPDFVSCEACYEDRILTNHFFVNFEPAQLQPAEDIWSCDIAVPFIEKEYEARGKVNDWAGFVSETKTRMSIKPCPQRNLELTYGRKWFVPKRGPEGLVLCSGCYCDQVIHTGEEALWEVDEKLTKSYDTRVRCSMGIFSIRMAMACAHDVNDFQVFWRSIHKLANEKFCDDDGIEDGIWYTLPSDPSNFGICAGCYAAIAESLNISRFFVPKPDAQPAGTKWRCCFNLSHPRFRQFMPRLLEMYHTHDPTSFDKFASVYCSIPVCPRDEDAQNKHWYGWMDCTICPECYQDFAQQSPLAANMELDNTVLETNTMCEMYSPRMRDIYIKCSKASPPDVRELLSCSVQRRLVWMQTIPQMRMMLFQANMALNQQRFLNVTSSHYNQVGMLQDITYGHTHTYGAAGVGYGYANENLLQGAVYAQQAAQAGVSAASGSAVLLVGQLEQQWRAVE
ncbi:hypothetical protein GL218_08274 [Daldinia childiae]|uniref:uncharacterized protein n=1 Tax=Daldinia childiae TaxID=326645 RepID=UPI001445F6FC|nr:uncharacterized protein GL218_08274 [Daldinia childiae]KAF3068476.1 hypothetical protein GL218_08274 [Daldinia childiae]